MTDSDDVLDSLFHGCGLRAYLEILAQTGQFPPDSEATRPRAYELYEVALADKNGRPRDLTINRERSLSNDQQSKI